MKRVVIAGAALAAILAITSSSSRVIQDNAPAVPNKGITGFGADLATWKSHHVADKSGDFIPGCCYNPDPKLKSWGGNFRYTDVVITNGIVTEYSLNLPENTKLADAKAAAMSELPKDAKVSFFYSHKDSATLEVSSATLRPILNRPAITGTNGSVDFVFCSVGHDGSFGFHETNVNSIWVKLGLGLKVAKDAVC